jgi:replicative superfamily II helicase
VIQDLANRIWSHDAFQTEYREVLRRGISSAFSFETITGESDDTFDLSRVVQSAAHLAGSNVREHREAAYRIGIYALKLSPSDWDAITDVLTVILSRLGNFPAVKYLADSVAPSDSEYSGIPFGTAVDIEFHRYSNTISVTPHVTRVLTDFQRRLWNKLLEPHPTAVSAPTSAGKSFALLNYVASRVAENPHSWALYLVPTRALISQVSEGLLSTFVELGVSEEVIVTQIPVPPNEQGANGGVYVLTQERAQVLLESSTAPSFSLVVVDEAQGVADDGRGILLQSVVESLSLASNGRKFLFAAPPVSNPEEFGKIFGMSTLESVVERESPVAQNLIFVDSDPHQRTKIRLSIAANNGIEFIGESKAVHELAGDDQSLAVVAWSLGQGKQNIVYAGGKAKCESIASLIMELAISQETRGSTELDDFAQFVRDHVHKDFLLAETVRRRVGFHYGNMPAVVRKELEHFSASGALQFLVCTSTLLQGVNLPASNLFLLKPTKGRDWEDATDVPLGPGDFWNLAGRAGRLGKEFEGNVFMIDTSRWSTKPYDGPREQPVVASLARNVRERAKELLVFINDREHPSGKQGQSGMENAFAKLSNAYRAERLEATLNQFLSDDDKELKASLEASLAAALDAITVPMTVAEHNAAISIYRQQEMYNYLLKKIADGKADEAIPVHPLRPEAYQSILRLFKRIHTRFEKRPTGDKSHTFFAVLALQWMRGEPLPLIIESHLKQRTKKAKRGSPSVATVIRETLDLIEQQLRFRYVKFVKCYLDLLSAALEGSGKADLLPSIPPLHLYLELGASSQTMMNLIGIGLTRTTAGIVSEAAVDKAMQRPEALKWLSRQLQLPIATPWRAAFSVRTSWGVR